MAETEFEQFGITKEEFDSIYAKKKKIRNYAFGISSAVGIAGGSLFGIYLAKSLYETVLFILFFGCFLGALFGAVFTIAVKTLHTLLLYIFSPAYRNCRRYRREKAKTGYSSELNW
ncbi:MAG: hypothetical protein HY809_01860 [Nitrospirae bacterium]|nr:hypothetical protein [Nitrospirota bacterium]